MHGQHAQAPHDDSAKHGHGEPSSARSSSSSRGTLRGEGDRVGDVGVFTLGLLGSITICLVIARNLPLSIWKRRRSPESGSRSSPHRCRAR